MMMIRGDKKKIAMFIIGKGDVDNKSDKEESDNTPHGLNSAMEKFIEAVHDKDVEKSVKAIMEFMSIAENCDQDENPDK